jgi:hypothetical protein
MMPTPARTNATPVSTAQKDWGVCTNSKSPRAGLLTFEHMGCPQYEWDGREDYRETKSGKNAMKRFEEAEEELQSWTRTKHNPVR